MFFSFCTNLVCYSSDSRDHLVFRDQMAHKEKKAREDPEVSLVLLDHGDPLERE